LLKSKIGKTKMKLTAFIILIISLAISSLQARTLNVGPASDFKTPSQAAAIAQTKDTILIQAGTYLGDVCYWAPDSITIKGINGFAHLEANGKSYGQKAIWVIGGNDYTIDHIEFSGCKVPDHNGAGIRQEGRNLTVRRCYFHHNENGILAGADTTSFINIEYSEFGYSGFGDGYSHNVYIGKIGYLRFYGNYSHNSNVGHLLKSRAYTNIIQYNLFSDNSDGNSSMHVDLPNGGFSIIIGNNFYQNEYSENSRIITYGTEGLVNPSKSLYCINNTFINNRETCTFLYMPAGTYGIVANNLAGGVGKYQIESNDVHDTTNLQFENIEDCKFVDVNKYEFTIEKDSPAIDAGTSFAYMSIFPMEPDKQYKNIANITDRKLIGNIDVGAYEYVIPESVENNEMINKKYRVYPNPVKDLLNIDGIDNFSTNILIYNISGKLVKTIYSGSNMNISDLPTGYYFLITENDKSNCSYFIKQ
jgi:hypothetical protein